MTTSTSPITVTVVGLRIVISQSGQKDVLQEQSWGERPYHALLRAFWFIMEAEGAREDHLVVERAH